MKGLLFTAVVVMVLHYGNAKDKESLGDSGHISNDMSPWSDKYEAELERYEREADNGRKLQETKKTLNKPKEKTKSKQRSKQRVMRKNKKRKGKTTKKNKDRKKKVNKKNKGSKKKRKNKGKKKKKKRQNNVVVEKKPHEGPYGYMHPEEIDWTEAKYRCPECEDTLIIYDPWWGPPPELHIPIFCTSNLSAFDSSTDLHNFGPNITVIFIPGVLNCSNPDRARQVNKKQFSIEVSQEVEEEDASNGISPEEVEPQYDCGKSEQPNIEDVACGLELPHSSANRENHNCFWHFFAYQHWRRQLLFTEWDFPSCADNSTKGECCRAGPHMLISKTGYAKKLTPYCGPDAPTFEKSDFEKGKARWLVLFNNSKNSENFSPKIGIESPTIGWRKSAAYDQLYYGQKCMCGVRGTKGPKQRPSVDPELALLDPPADSPSRNSPSRKSPSRKSPLKNKGGKNPTRWNKPGRKKTKRKKTTKANKKRKMPKKKNGLVKREAFPKESNPSKLRNVNKKKDRKKNAGRTKGKKKRRKGKKSRRRGKLRQGESGASDESDVRTRQVWPWMASIAFNSSFICAGHSVSPRIVVTSTRCFPSLFWAKWVTKGTNMNTHLNQSSIEEIYEHF